MCNIISYINTAHPGPLWIFNFEMKSKYQVESIIFMKKYASSKIF